MSLKKGKLLAEYNFEKFGYIWHKDGTNLEWDNFLQLITREMERRKSNGRWERQSKYKRSDGIYTSRDSFCAYNGKQLFYDVTRMDASSHPGVEPWMTAEVFVLGGEGLQITKTSYAGNKYDFFILPECHDGFYRDWERDGICVSSIVEDKFEKGIDDIRKTQSLSSDQKEQVIRWAKKHGKVPNDIVFDDDGKIKSAKVTNFKRKS